MEGRRGKKKIRKKKSITTLNYSSPRNRNKNASKFHLYNSDPRRIFFIGVKLSTGDFPAKSLVLNKISEAKR